MPQRPLRLALVPLLLLALGLGPLRGGQPAPAGKTAGGRYALLVGCSTYKALGPRWRLNAPPNDVDLLRKVLCERYHFAPKDVTALSDAAGEQPPTRANIAKAFAQLARKARAGDLVVVLLAGHGLRHPELKLPPGVAPSPDGYRPAFLPTDSGPYVAREEGARNAILDYELRAWTRAIAGKGAFLWVIVDCCHSGTICRGADGEKVRAVPPDVLFPEGVLRRARQKAEALRGKAGGALPEPKPALDGTANLVAVYACLPGERTVERTLPRRGKDARPHGLLTYTLCRELTQARARLTYRELVQRARAAYARIQYFDSTPFTDFEGKDRVVLGRDGFLRAVFLLKEAGPGRWRVNGGALHGLTRGSVLEVRPPAGTPGADRVVGHVRLTEVRTLEADVEPCALGKHPKNEKLLPESGCKPVQVDYGELRLRVAVVRARPIPQERAKGWRDQLAAALRAPDAEARRLERGLRELAAREGTLFRLVPAPAEADWVVCAADKGVHLLRRGALVREVQGELGCDWLAVGGDGKDHLVLRERPGPEGPATPVSRFGPGPAGGGLLPWLKDGLERVARVQLLLRLAASSAAAPARGEGAVEVGVQVARREHGPDGKKREVDLGKGRPTLHHGDPVVVRVTNRSPDDEVHLILLVIDNAYGIAQFYPPRGQASVVALGPDRTVELSDQIDADGRSGPEHLVVIAVKAGEGREPLDLSWLEQSPLGKAPLKRRAPPRAAGPLDELIRRAVGGGQGARSLGGKAIDDHVLRLCSWWTSARLRTELRR
jgi:hypothetical protein